MCDYRAWRAAGITYDIHVAGAGGGLRVDGLRGVRHGGWRGVPGLRVSSMYLVRLVVGGGTDRRHGGVFEMVGVGSYVT